MIGFQGRFPAIGAVLLLLLATGCLGPKGDTIAEKQASALAMRDRVLVEMIENDPDLKADVDKSLGYAVLNNFSIHPGMFSFAAGYGVIWNKSKERNSHVRWTRLTLGPGIAVKGIYVLVLFHDQELMESFEDGRWTAGGQAEASLVFGDFGGGLELAWIFNRKVDVSYMTHTGVALEIELFGVGVLSDVPKLNTTPAP